MRNTVLKVSLFLCAFILLSANHVSAISTNQLALTDDPFHYSERKKTEVNNTPKPEFARESKPVEAEKPAPVTPAVEQYTVLPGDSLTKIATDHQTDWKRLFAKNTEVINPDTITAGEILTIPAANEQLAERPLPEPPVAIVATSTLQTSTRSVGSVSQARGSSAGNTYAPGYCTWYAKSRRPDLPNRLGNANAWVASAAAQGFATGSSPQAGAIGQQGNHVVYVEAVNGDGSVTVSEMNYSGLGVISSRTVSASNFTYIY